MSDADRLISSMLLAADLRTATTLTNAPPREPSADWMLDTLRQVQAQINALPKQPRYMYCTPWAWRSIRRQAERLPDPRPMWEYLDWLRVTITASMKLPRCGWVVLHERDPEMDADALPADVEPDVDVRFTREI